ncbi:MAG: hypothetical protein ACU836_06390 [Gammaproteobacteria bacterium]
MITGKLKCLIFLAVCILSVEARAALLIDGFTDPQDVYNGTDGPVNVKNTGLTSLLRTLEAKASNNAISTEVVVDSGYLSIDNSADSNGTVKLTYSFDSIDVASTADEFLLDVAFMDASDKDLRVKILAKSMHSKATFGFINLGLGKHEIEFSDFTDPSVFSELNGLELTFRGATALDSAIGSLQLDGHTVPEPSIFGLLAIGAIAFNRIGPKKTIK